MGDKSGLKKIIIGTDETKIQGLIDIKWTLNNDFFLNETTQLNEYFQGTRKQFDIKLNPEGTSYQKKIWSILKTIPYGETRTYKEIAILSGDENGARAIGTAAGKNPIPIIIPCHRVIGSSGKLTGFAFGIDIKRSLLNTESSYN